MRKSDPKRLNAANSIPDSFQAFDLEESDEHIVGTALGANTARSARAKNDQEI